MGKKKAASKLAVAAGAAKVQAHDLQERLTPAVEDARDRLAPRIAEARDRIGPAVEDARERLAPHVADARERLTPMVEDARGRLTPMVEDARDRLTPVMDDARDRLADLAENVATRLDDALPDDRTPALVKNASANKSGGKLKKLLVVTGLGTVAFVVAKRLRSGSEPQWQSTAPARPASPAAPTASEQAASAAGAPAAAVAGLVSADEATPNPDADDAGGGTPDEVASDALDSPHVPTTPDNPAETVQLDKE